jgi:hypothetical protein
MSLFDITKINVCGKEYFEHGRLEKATAIIHKLEYKHKKMKMLISGSFLFNKTYNDIDVFIFTKYSKKDYINGKIHVSFIPESALDSIFFNSISRISVSNFIYTQKTDMPLGISELLQTYELLINALLNNEECKNCLRDFVLQSEYFSKGVILDPKQLYYLTNVFSRKNIAFLSYTFINNLTLCYDSAVNAALKMQIDNYKELLKDYANSKNISIYIDTYTKVIELASGRCQNNNKRDLRQ